MNRPTVFVVILNTNRREDTLSCLRSLSRSDYKPIHPIILDNASTDGSVEAISQEFPGTRIVSLKKNKGYAGNNNIGIQAAIESNADWILILNEDTIMSSECISHLVTTGESSKSIGIVGPMVFHADQENIIQSAGGSIDKYWNATHFGLDKVDSDQFSEIRHVDWISGCALMIRKETIFDVGYFDERFFYYWEEVDYCIRARHKGWEILHVPQAKLWHKGVFLNYSPNPHVTYYSTRNKLLLLSKNKPSILVWIITLYQMIRTVISWSVKPQWKTYNHHRNAIILGIKDFFCKRWGEIPSLTPH